MDPTSIARLQLVVPRLSQLIYQLETRMLQENIQIRVTAGLRSMAEQRAIYAQGRLPLDQVNALRKIVGLPAIGAAENNKVSNAPAGYSWHEFGMAVDVCPDDMHGNPDWNISHPAWGRIVAIGESLGLTSGISWHDEPHLQLSGKYPVAAPNDECRAIAQQSGIEEVWETAFA